MEEPDRSAATSSRIRSVAARADVINFDGYRYRGTSLRTHPPYDRIGSIPSSHLQEIGTATRRPGRCTNQPSADSALPLSVRVASIDGVSPEIAIAALPRGNVYLREGAEVPRILTSAPWIQWRMSG
jgi:hypothetical protein